MSIEHSLGNGFPVTSDDSQCELKSGKVGILMISQAASSPLLQCVEKTNTFRKPPQI